MRDLANMEEFLRNADAVNIVSKIKSQTEQYFDTIVSTQKTFWTSYLCYAS